MASLLLLASATGLPDSFAPGRTAVITGAAAGLGRAAALRCAERGMRVCLVDVDEPELATASAVVSAACANGDADVMSSCTDVSDRASVEALCTEVYERFGEVGFLFSNAGTGNAVPSIFSSAKAWERNLGVNLHGNLHVVQAFVPRMLEQATACTIAVTGSKQGITCPPGNVAYNVAKSGVRVLTEALQHELRGSEHAERVQAHLFVPGFVNTNLAVNYFKDLQGEAFDAESVPWSEAKPAAGGWMPLQTIDYMLEAIGRGQFYILCPDNDVTAEMDAKRIAWAAGDVITRDVPLSRWEQSGRYKEEFAAFMAGGTPSDGVR